MKMVFLSRYLKKCFSNLKFKIFVIPDVPPTEKDQLEYDIKRQVKVIREQTAHLQHLSTVAPWMVCECGDKAAYLIRQCRVSAKFHFQNF